MTRIRVIDFESTGDSPDEGKHGLCEIGYTDLVARAVDLHGQPFDWEIELGRSRLCNPLVPIPPATMAVHHIMNEDVADQPDWRILMRSFVRSLRPDGVIALGAHSADNERLWFHPDWWEGEEPLPFACTYKAALRVWPDAPLHSNMGLRYHRRPVGLDRNLALPAHRAGPDAYVTAFHLRDLLNEGTPLQQIIEWTKLPALTVRCYVGDYRNGGDGTPWKDVPTSMLEWILRTGFHGRPDVRYTAQVTLDERMLQFDQEQERRDLNAQFRLNGMAELPTTSPEPPPDMPPPVAVQTPQGELLL